ncbi:MAG: DUF302 domain-containing protein [Candidatus Krumholzibacteria bacterium]|nr:DUF302 domain-containing protein [Candidatus Krumholzibacteria bacterium]
MSYFFAKTLEAPFEEVIDRVTDALQQKGFGILTEIDVKETLKKKLDVDFHPYRILGACNPSMAHKALLLEDKIGTMLPCNVIVQDVGGGKIEVAAVDPAASMMAVENAELENVAGEVRGMLEAVIDGL